MLYQHSKIRSLFFFVFSLIVFLITVTLFRTQPTRTQAIGKLVIYDDALSPNFINWSWGNIINWESKNKVFSGLYSIQNSPTPWGALYLHARNPIQITDYDKFNFSLRAENSGEKFVLMFYDVNNQLINKPLSLSDYGGNPTSDAWKNYSIPLSDVSQSPVNISGFALQEVSGETGHNFSIDSIELSSIAPTTQITPTVSNKDYILYADSLAIDWVNWSWDSEINFSNSNQSYDGLNSISLRATRAWGGLYLHNDIGISTIPYTNLNFTGKATQTGQKYALVLFDINNQPISSPKPLDNFGAGLSPNNWTFYSIPLTSLNAQNKLIKGIGILSLLPNAQPTLYLDSISFTNLPIPQRTTPAPTTSHMREALIPPNSGYTAANNKIYKNGVLTSFRGINWFGFETGTYAPHGLWSRNWKEIINQIKNLGFNAVRIPFCPKSIQGILPNSINYAKNPDLSNLSSLQILDKIVEELNNQKISILLDHHTIDCSSIPDLWYTSNYSESQWITDLKFIANRYKNTEYFAGIDLKNEPKGIATWGTGNLQTDWNTAAEKAGQAVLSVNPNILIFVQGIQENPTCSTKTAHWQGGNLEPFVCTPLAENAIPKQKLVFSPHIYGPDVYPQPYFQSTTFPLNMPDIWNTHFGFLLDKGYTIIPGEWGGKYGTNNGNPKDIVLQDGLVSYFKSKHICNSFYWDLNPNSSDTGGILEDDWRTVWPDKIRLIKDYFNSCI